MGIYVSLLRGINVSGQKMIKMADLKLLYEETGFTHVKTYIQSGNVIFETKKASPSAIASKIEKAIEKRYGFDVSVLVLDTDDLKDVVGSNPFADKKDIPEERLYVTFLSGVPAAENINALELWSKGPECFEVSGKTIYTHYPAGYGNSRLTNNVFEAKLKVTATTRNWKTTNELLRIALAF